MFYLTGYLGHAASVQCAAAALGLRARMQLEDFSLEIGEGTLCRTWRARFVGTAHGRLAYFDRMNPAARGFAGWLPYALRRWEIASSKMAFKHYAAAQGIATPAACTDPSRIAGPFLVKKQRSSFGEGIRGPFLRFDAGDPAQALGEGEYYENFILGHVVKAWYWGRAWAAVEIRQPPIVTGDGSSTLRKLVQARPDNTPDRPADWQAIDGLARYCGLPSVDAVPAQGQEVLIDYKYASRYEPMQSANRNAIGRLQGTTLAAQFERAGEVLSRGVGDLADATLFTLDAILDAQGTLWFLEMNSNPMVHPDVYAPMLRHEFAGLAEPTAGAGARPLPIA